MSNSVHLIPRTRLKSIPPNLRLAHEYCFFVHDQCVHVLKEYEDARAHNVTIKFQNEAETKRFVEAGQGDALTVMRQLGYGDAARKVILNNITFALTSDALHHIYEALRCLERRKIIVALNLLRKPLMDSLLHLSWMLGEPDGFYEAFTSGDPATLTAKKLGNRRSKIIEDALAQTRIGGVIDAEFIRATIFDRRYEHGLQKGLQHAVHLVTVEYEELKTAPENFNFIFKNPMEDDFYEVLYENLPPLLFYLSHVIVELFGRIRALDDGAMTAFRLRTIHALMLLQKGEEADKTLRMMVTAFEGSTRCSGCQAPYAFSAHNAARVLIAESIRCGKCRRVSPFPFSWLF